MRHRVYGKHLGRDKDTRETLFKGLVQAIFTHGTIATSEAKAKSIKGLVDKVINLAKEKKFYQFGLTKEILAKLGDRTSGYTSLVKMGRRPGDQTMRVKMSLIGAEEIKPTPPKKKVIAQKPTIKRKTSKIKK
ncbi:MAG: L17 family ribosomal protein [Candidatus Daviesbacteria bacterium]|nr:L17 family ribosomal protein [Candidatus Daviesbacteria bacterium]